MNIIREPGSDAAAVLHAVAVVRGIDLPETRRRRKAVQLRFHAPVATACPAAAVQRVWNNDAYGTVATPPGLPRMAPDASCPAGSFAVEIDYISHRTGGMSSWHGYAGWFLALVFAPDGRAMLDARAERAS